MDQQDVRVGAYRLDALVTGSRATYWARDTRTKERCVVKLFRGQVAADLRANITTTLERLPRQPGPVCALIEVGFHRDQIYAAAPVIEGMSVDQIIKAVALRRDLTGSYDHQRITAWLLSEFTEGVWSRNSDQFDRGVFDPDMVFPRELFVLFDGRAQAFDVRWNWLGALSGGPPAADLEQNLSYKSPVSGAHLPGDAGRCYALGVMLWELLSGFRLFRKDGAVPPLRDINPTVSKELASLAERAISKPGALSLRELSKGLRTIARMDDAEASALVRVWIADLFPHETRAACVTSRPDSSSDLDALLSGSQSWSMVESSRRRLARTQSSPGLSPMPPSVRLDGPFELSWLENSRLPNVDESERRPRVLGVLLGLGLGVFTLLGGLVLSRTLSHQAAGGESLAARTSQLSEVRSEPTFQLAARPMAEPMRLVRTEPLPELAEELEFDSRPTPNAVRHAAAVPAAPHDHPASSSSTVVTGDTLVLTGELYIRAPENGRVYEGTRLLGVGAVRVRLAEGEHTVKVEVEGAPPTYGRARVRPGAPTLLDLR